MIAIEKGKKGLVLRYEGYTTPVTKKQLAKLLAGMRRMQAQYGKAIAPAWEAYEKEVATK